MEFPEPVIQVAIEPKTKAGQDKMTMALVRLAEEDPTFKTYTDDETGQTIIAGMGELHLEIIVDRLLREFKVEATVGKPQVAYKETHPPSGQRRRAATCARPAATASTATASSSSSPREPGTRLRVREQGRRRRRFPRNSSRPSDDGIREAAKSGLLGGFEVVDFKATLLDGSYHEVDSSRNGVQDRRLHGLQGRAGARRTARLLEPMMKVEVVVPDEYMGDVMGNMTARRGRDRRHGSPRGLHRSFDAHGAACARCSATPPTCAAATQGRGTYTMQFAHYAARSARHRR